MPIAPVAVKPASSRPSVATAVRTPKFCTWRALTAVPPSSPRVRVDGHELHVHEGALARLVELRVRHHRVVPVEHLALRGSVARRLRDGGIGSRRRLRGRRLLDRRAARSEPVSGPAGNDADGDDGGEGRDEDVAARCGRGVHEPSFIGRTNWSQAQAFAAACSCCSNASRASSSLRRASSTGASAPVPPRYDGERRVEPLRGERQQLVVDPLRRRARRLPLGEHRVDLGDTHPSRVLAHRACRVELPELRGVLAVLPRPGRPRQVDRDHQRHHVRIGRAADRVGQLRAPVGRLRGAREVGLGRGTRFAGERRLDIRLRVDVRKLRGVERQAREVGRAAERTVRLDADVTRKRDAGTFRLGRRVRRAVAQLDQRCSARRGGPPAAPCPRDTPLRRS